MEINLTTILIIHHLFKIKHYWITSFKNLVNRVLKWMHNTKNDMERLEAKQRKKYMPPVSMWFLKENRTTAGGSLKRTIEGSWWANWELGLGEAGCAVTQGWAGTRICPLHRRMDRGREHFLKPGGHRSCRTSCLEKGSENTKACGSNPAGREAGINPWRGCLAPPLSCGLHIGQTPLEAREHGDCQCGSWKPLSRGKFGGNAGRTHRRLTHKLILTTTSQPWKSQMAFVGWTLWKTLKIRESFHHDKRWLLGALMGVDPLPGPHMCVNIFRVCL